MMRPISAKPTSKRVSRAILKKHVGLIHSSASLTLVQRKLFNWLLLQAYDGLLTVETHRIRIDVLRGLMGWSASRNDDALRDALVALTSTSAQFNLLNDDLGIERFETAPLLSFGSIESGWVEWRYDKSMAKKLHHPSVYGVLNLVEQQNLTSAYSSALYEQVVRFQEVRRTSSIPVMVLRELLGTSLSTPFKYFRRDVIDPSVKEINAVTDLGLEVIYKKEGRVVVEIQFAVEKKRQQNLLSPVTEDPMITNLALVNRLKKLGLSTVAIKRYLQSHPIKQIEAWVLEVEQKLLLGQIKTSASGYLASVVALPPPEIVTSKKVALERQVANTALIKQQIEEREQQSRATHVSRNEVTLAIARLTGVDHEKLTKKFIATLQDENGALWNSALRQFSNRSIDSRYRLWLRGQV